MGILNFDLYQCKVRAVLSKQLTVDIEGNDRQFLFELEDEDSRDEWLKAIDSNIKDSQGYKLNRSAPFTKEFWR